MHHSRPILAFKPFILFPHTSYLLPLHPYHRLMLLAVSLHLLLPQGLSMECWGSPSQSTEFLYLISSHPVDLICIQESNLNLSSSFRIPGFSTLRFDRSNSRSGIFSTDVKHVAAVSSFSSGKAYTPLNFLPPLFLHLAPTLIM